MNNDPDFADGGLWPTMAKSDAALTGAGRTWSLVSIAAVERREAPHPYVIGVRAPSQRRAAGRVMVRQGLPRKHPGASRRSISLACKG
jgi:hypothetical protein